MTGHYSLDATERAVSRRLAGLPIDRAAMSAVGNLYRAAGRMRNHFERTVLAEQSLTWTAWVVLWVVWLFDELETRHVAEEAGISKPTLTGVVTTLEGRGLVRRRRHPDDGRRVLLSLTANGQEVMAELFPKFNQYESQAVAVLNPQELATVSEGLRKVITHLEDLDGVAPPALGGDTGNADTAPTRSPAIG